MKKPTSVVRREKRKRQKQRLQDKGPEPMQTPLPETSSGSDLETREEEGEESSWEDSKRARRLHQSYLHTPQSEHAKQRRTIAVDLQSGASSSRTANLVDSNVDTLRELYPQLLEHFYPEDKDDIQEADQADQDPHASDEEEPVVLSNRKLRKLKQVPVSQLKQEAQHPEVVEWEDSTAPDPHFLVTLKCLRNTLPVPKHWSRKRRYLAGKRGFFKTPFELPPFLHSLNITTRREELLKADAKKTQKVKAREKMHPKLGRLPLDFQLMYDAFFKHQTKPSMTMFGDVYYEGKDLEGKRKERRPGTLSAELRTALGMGPASPPPWLFAMQRHGPPPAYPLLRIPGLTAPLPPGAQWGYHAGGWGKPPAHLADCGPSTGLDGLLSSDLRPKRVQPWFYEEPDDDEGNSNDGEETGDNVADGDVES